MDINKEQIEKEFERQVNLCAVIGKSKMIEIIENKFKDLEPTYDEKQHCGHHSGFDECKYKHKDILTCYSRRCPFLK